MSHRQTPHHRPLHPKNLHYPYSSNRPPPNSPTTPRQQWPLRPPSPSAVSNRWLPAPSFAVELRSHRRFFRVPVVEPLIKQCNPAPHKYFVYTTGFVAGRMFFRRKSDAAEAVLFFWERRIAGDHVLSPFVKFFDDELEERVKGLFVSHVKSLVGGELMQRMEKKIELLLAEVRKVSARLRKPKRINFLSELRGKRAAYQAEIELISKRMEEFRRAMQCVIRCIEGDSTEHLPINGEFEVFKFEDGLDWSRIHSIVMRECRRLEDGLPIYGFRLEIIRKLFSEQAWFCIPDFPFCPFLTHCL